MTMPKRDKLVCLLNLTQPRKVPSNLVPFKLSIHVAGAADPARVAATDVDWFAPGETLPVPPSTWLQIWHVGRWEQGNLKPVPDAFERALRDADAQSNPPSNDLLIQIPGHVVQLPSGELPFRLATSDVPQEPSGPTKGPAKGWFHLQLHDARGVPWKPHGRDVTIRIFSTGGDDDCDLACVFAPAAADRATANAPTARPLI